MIADIASISAQFAIPGSFVSAAPHGNGHINDTYVATYQLRGKPARYVHQRINRHVFTDPAAVMHNIRRVTEHLCSKLAGADAVDPPRRTLAVVPTLAGEPLLQRDDGSCWRTYCFIEGTHAHEFVERPEQAERAAFAFGDFQARLADLPPPTLTETIAGFHDTPRRFRAWEQALAAAAPQRLDAARNEIALTQTHRGLARTLVDLQAAGAVPARITHNDTKLNNVLFDTASGAAVCVVDLDTVMPGLSLYDFGDMVRTMTCTAAEDETDLARIDARPELFAAVARGYLAAAGGMLNATECTHLVAAGKTIVFEQGLRFLTDYLAGDIYYKVERPEHNLQRCRAQYTLLLALIRREAELQACVRAALRAAGAGR